MAMTMSKQTYEATANVINDMMESMNIPSEGSVKFTQGAVWAVQSIAEDLARVFERDNFRFDKDKFMKACGLE
jgi:hypothetical protein